VRREIHRQKAGLARDVDLAQPPIELERVERDDLCVEQQQVLEV
jgi:hypothetical protein